MAGFLLYDFFFIPLYLTQWVGAPENWAALGVYAVVTLPVARVVAGLNEARASELRQGRELRELFELSDLLVEDKPLDVLLPALVAALSEVFDARQVALFLPARDPASSNRMELAASAGEPLSDAPLRTVLPAPGAAASRLTGTGCAPSSGPTAVIKSWPCLVSIRAIVYPVSGFAYVIRSSAPSRTGPSRLTPGSAGMATIMAGGQDTPPGT